MLESQEEPQKVLKDLCNMCQKQEHKYKCPRCFALTCSLACSKEHKEMTGCTGQKDHVSTLNIKMNDFSLGVLRKDL